MPKISIKNNCEKEKQKVRQESVNQKFESIWELSIMRNEWLSDITYQSKWSLKDKIYISIYIHIYFCIEYILLYIWNFLLFKYINFYIPTYFGQRIKK